MKNTALSLLLFLSSVLLIAQEKKEILKSFSTNGMQTNFLTLESGLFSIQDYNTKTINTYSFYQAYKTIAQAQLTNQLPVVKTLKNIEKQSYFTQIIPIAFLQTTYETIKPEAFTTQKVIKTKSGNLIRNTPETIFNRHNLTLIAPLRTKHKGLTTTFNLNSTTYFNTTSKKIKTITGNFNDGFGFRTLHKNQNITINYTTAGKKELTFKIEYIDGSYTLRKSEIEIDYSNADYHRINQQNIITFTGTTTPNLTAYGESTSYTGVGEYEVFLSPDQVLDKPIFIVDGFDPDDSRDINGIYNLLNFETNGTLLNLADLVRNEGFDVVILNFPIYTRAADSQVIDGGVDFIERNALLLVDLITSINNTKMGSEPNVVIGPSMGGLISRYALNYMENQNLSHDTRLFLSFDSPHLGANVPIGFQHQFNFLAYGLNDFWFIGDQNVEALQPIIDGMLKSAAARQMLTDQFEAHLQSGSAVEFDSSLNLPQEHPFKTTFYNQLNALTSNGFPQQVRNVTMINGSGINSRYPNINGTDILPGEQIVNTTFNVTTGTDATLKINFTPYANTSVETSYVYIDFAWYIPAFDVTSNAYSQAFSYSNGIDAASGGLFDLSDISGQIDPNGIAGNFINALQTNYFNFIPSVSAMAFQSTNNEINWFHTPNNITTGRNFTTSITPFENWHMPTENQPHVTLTEQNVDFALDEILQPTLTENAIATTAITLAKNPIKNSFTLLSSTLYKNVTLSILDNTGKLVVTEKRDIDAKTTIPITLASGMYILKISALDTPLNFVTKLIVQ